MTTHPASKRLATVWRTVAGRPAELLFKVEIGTEAALKEISKRLAEADGEDGLPIFILEELVKMSGTPIVHGTLKLVWERLLKLGRGDQPLEQFRAAMQAAIQLALREDAELRITWGWDNTATQARTAES